MRGRVAKAIRKLVYGDAAQRDTKYVRAGGCIVAVGLREQYKYAKEYYNSIRRGE